MHPSEVGMTHVWRNVDATRPCPAASPDGATTASAAGFGSRGCGSWAVRPRGDLRSGSPRRGEGRPAGRIPGGRRSPHDRARAASGRDLAVPAARTARGTIGLEWADTPRTAAACPGVRRPACPRPESSSNTGRRRARRTRGAASGKPRGRAAGNGSRRRSREAGRLVATIPASAVPEFKSEIGVLKIRWLFPAVGALRGQATQGVRGVLVAGGRARDRGRRRGQRKDPVYNGLIAGCARRRRPPGCRCGSARRLTARESACTPTPDLRVALDERVRAIRVGVRRAARVAGRDGDPSRSRSTAIASSKAGSFAPASRRGRSRFPWPARSGFRSA